MNPRVRRGQRYKIGSRTICIRLSLPTYKLLLRRAPDRARASYIEDALLMRWATERPTPQADVGG